MGLARWKCECLWLLVSSSVRQKSMSQWLPVGALFCSNLRIVDALTHISWFGVFDNLNRVTLCTVVMCQRRQRHEVCV